MYVYMSLDVVFTYSLYKFFNLKNEFLSLKFLTSQKARLLTRLKGIH